MEYKFLLCNILVVCMYSYMYLKKNKIVLNEKKTSQKKKSLKIDLNDVVGENLVLRLSGQKGPNLPQIEVFYVL